MDCSSELKKTKMYLSARISEDAHAWNNEICDAISDRFNVFKPQDYNPYQLDHRKFQEDVYQVDLNAMIESEIGLLLTPYGRDCAWEVGWYSSSSKPLVMYAEKDVSWTRDWMIKGGIDHVFVTESDLYDLLNNDGIVSQKVTKIDSKADLSDAIDYFLKSYQSS